MVKNKISRAQFLRGDYRGGKVVIRPPWSLSEHDFVERCTRCGDCLDACPEKILIAGRGGFPQLDFARGECSFCQLCQRACREPAFTSTDQRPWLYYIEIKESCLSRNGVTCVTCAEQCEAEAIHFVPRVGSVPQPQVSTRACTGCGACYRPCPVGAIIFQKFQLMSDKQPS